MSRIAFDENAEWHVPKNNFVKEQHNGISTPVVCLEKHQATISVELRVVFKITSRTTIGSADVYAKSIHMSQCLLQTTPMIRIAPAMQFSLIVWNMICSSLVSR